MMRREKGIQINKNRPLARTEEYGIRTNMAPNGRHHHVPKHMVSNPTGTRKHFLLRLYHQIPTVDHLSQRMSQGSQCFVIIKVVSQQTRSRDCNISRPKGKPQDRVSILLRLDHLCQRVATSAANLTRQVKSGSPINRLAISSSIYPKHNGRSPAKIAPGPNQTKNIPSTF